MAISHLVTRTSEVMLSSTTTDILILLIAIITASLIVLGVLFIVRKYRRSAKKDALPLYADCCSAPKPRPNRFNFGAFRQLRYSKSTCVYNEKRDLLSTTTSSTSGPLPEIRITFPEELDESGKAQSGRVVVVHVGERGDIGLEPFHETLPAYQSNSSDRFQSLDLERIGGLKEKA